MTPSITTPVPQVQTASNAVFAPPSVLRVESCRVKCVDIHDSKPWLLLALYDGSVNIHNVATGELIKTLTVSTTPVRAARFISRQGWLIVGSDDLKIRVYGIESGEIITEFPAHDDFIRTIEVHKSLPLVISTSDDKTAKVWDWSREWACAHILHGHEHYVMGSALTETSLATVSLDHTTRLWSISSDAENSVVFEPIGSLKHHARGINAVALDATGSRLVTGSDDRTLAVWDVASATVVAVLHGHTNNVTSVLFHPTLPLIISGAEDGSIRLWNSQTLRAEGVWTHGLGRVWTLTTTLDGRLAIGFDQGAIVMDMPAATANDNAVAGAMNA